MGFPFLFAICFAAMIGVAFVNVDKGREDARRFAEARKLARAKAWVDSDNNRDQGEGVISSSNSALLR